MLMLSVIRQARERNGPDTPSNAAGKPPLFRAFSNGFRIIIPAVSETKSEQAMEFSA